MPIKLTMSPLPEDPKQLNAVRALYDSSFPDDERIPWKMLLKLQNENRLLHVFYMEHTLAAFTCLFLYRDIAYLSYLTVSEDMMNHGIGSAVLEHIKAALPQHRIVIDIEELNKDSDNYEERLRRRNFYLRCGFEPSGIGYYYYHVRYELLCCNGPISGDDFRNLLLYHWGPRSKSALFYPLKDISSE